MANNILGVFQTISAITNHKITNTLNDVKVLPINLPTIPGMDLTAGGEYYTYEEFVKIKNKADTLLSEKLALEVALQNLNCFLMHKGIYHQLVEELGLYMIYPIDKSRYSEYGNSITKDSFVIGNLHFEIDALLCIAQLNLDPNTKSKIYKSIIFDYHKYGRILNKPFGTRSDVKTTGVFEIVVTEPPSKVREIIQKTVIELSKANLSGMITVLADYNAFELHMVNYEYNPPQTSTVDPGIVYETNNFAVILQDTFYHISDLEQQFLDKALEVAEKWEAKKFLLN